MSLLLFIYSLLGIYYYFISEYNFSFDSSFKSYIASFIGGVMLIYDFFMENLKKTSIL